MAESASELSKQAIQASRFRQLQNRMNARTTGTTESIRSGTIIGYNTQNNPLARLENGAIVEVEQTSSGGIVQDEKIPFVRNGSALFGIWRSR